MQFEISRITIEVTDRESGRVVARELAPGSPWPCTPESLEEVAKRGDEPAQGEATGKKKAKRSKTAEPKSKAKKAKKKAPLHHPSVPHGIAVWADEGEGDHHVRKGEPIGTIEQHGICITHVRDSLCGISGPFMPGRPP